MAKTPAKPITEKALKALDATSKGSRLMDTAPRGFGVEVSAIGSVHFFFRYTASGRRRYLPIGEWSDVLTLTEARKRATVYRSAVDAGKDPVTEREKLRAAGLTLQVAVDQYVALRTDPAKNEKPMKPSTVRDLRGSIERDLADWLDRPITDLTGAEVVARFELIGRRSPTRANSTMRWLRAVVNFHGVDDNGDILIPVNPVEASLTRKRRWNTVQPKKGHVSDGDLARWYRAVVGLAEVPDRDLDETVARDGKRMGGRAKPLLKNGAMMRDFLLFVVLTGLRREEAARLEWSRVNLAEKLVVITDTKAHRTHVLPLTPFLLEILERRKADGAGSHVFADHREQRLQNLRYGLKRIEDQTGIKHSVHDLRRTFLNKAEALDLSHYVLKALVNHSLKGDVTAGYLDIDVERLRKPMEQITDAFLKAFGVKPSAEVVVLADRREAV